MTDDQWAKLSIERRCRLVCKNVLGWKIWDGDGAWPMVRVVEGGPFQLMPWIT